MKNSTTEQFLSAFRRFISRRGTTKFVFSDNASNLKWAERTLDYIFEHRDVQQFLYTKQIKWSNILAKAPWFSAIYERLIKTVKKCLKKTIKNSKVTVNELNTLLAETECMINNCPLTRGGGGHFNFVCTGVCGHSIEKLTHPQTKVGPSMNQNTPILRLFKTEID